MKSCETCGNAYDKCFEVIQDGQSHSFDSFECAIHALAPTCDHCQCRIIGHGMEADGIFYCCDHCAEASGVIGLKDRVDFVRRSKAQPPTIRLSHCLNAQNSFLNAKASQHFVASSASSDRTIPFYELTSPSQHRQR